MGTHQDAVQGAVVFVFAVVSALLHSALNAFVGMTVHVCFLLLFGYGNSMAWV